MSNRTRELEDQRDAAYKSAEATYSREYEAAVSEYERQRNAAEDSKWAESRTIWKAGARKSSDRAVMETSLAIKRVWLNHETRLQEIEDAYKALRVAIRARYDAAVAAAEDTFDRLWDEHHDAESRKEAAAERKRERAARKAAERERKRTERQRVADKFDLARQIAKATTPPVVTVSPQRAASMLGLTMGQFWALVRGGRYPAPRDDNTYDRDTIDRLPRPKVRVQRAIPSNVYTQIWRF